MRFYYHRIQKHNILWYIVVTKWKIMELQALLLLGKIALNTCLPAKVLILGSYLLCYCTVCAGTIQMQKENAKSYWVTCLPMLGLLFQKCYKEEIIAQKCKILLLWYNQNLLKNVIISISFDYDLVYSTMTTPCS